MHSNFRRGHLTLSLGHGCFTLNSLIRSTWYSFVPFDAGHWTRLSHYRMLREELGWGQQKSDELLLPVIQRVNRRGAAAAVNKQLSLDAYLGDSMGAAGGSAIPRKRQAYSSKRLQKVVTDYREEQRRRPQTTEKSGDSTLLDPDHSGQDIDVDGFDDDGDRDPTSGSMTTTGVVSKPTTITKAPTKRRTANERRVRKSSKGTTSTSASRSTKRKKQTNDSDDYGDDHEHVDTEEVASIPARPRPKPVRKKANTNPGTEPKLVGQGCNGESQSI